MVCNGELAVEPRMQERAAVDFHRNWLAETLGLLTNPIGGIAVPGNHGLTFLPLAHVLARS